MDDRYEEQFVERLKAGEGRYVEFKSPYVSLVSHDLGLAQILRAVIAFASTPGDQEAAILLGVVEGTSLVALENEVLKRLRDRRQVRDEDEPSWRAWVDRECVTTRSGKLAVVLSRPLELNGSPDDSFSNRIKDFIVQAQNDVRLVNTKYAYTTALPASGGVAVADVSMVLVPAPGGTPRSARVRMDIARHGREGLVAGYTYRRIQARNDERSADVSNELEDLGQQIEHFRTRVSKLTAMALVFAILLLALVIGMISNSKPALATRTLGGVVVDLKWADVKLADVQKQGGGMVNTPEAVAINELLKETRSAIQRRLYRVGPQGDTTTMFSDSDIGDGRLLCLARTDDAGNHWTVIGEGHIREFKRAGEDNNEMWGASVTSSQLTRLGGLEPVRMMLELTSSIPGPDDKVVLYCDVVLDEGSIWRPCQADVEYFGDRGPGKTRLFVDPTTLGVAPRGEDPHIATITWASTH